MIVLYSTHLFTIIAIILYLYYLNIATNSGKKYVQEASPSTTV